MTRSQTSEIPKGFIKNCTFQEEGKTFELYYNPTEKDATKAYIKKEVSA
jgi:hypothetical protein